MTSKIEELKEEFKEKQFKAVTQYGDFVPLDNALTGMDRAYAIGREQGIKIGIEKAVEKMRGLMGDYMKNFDCKCETCRRYGITNCTNNLGCVACHPDRLFDNLPSLTSDELLKK